MLQKVLLSLTLMVAFVGTAYSQIKIEGPKEGVAGYRIKGKLVLDAADPIVKCSPANDDWMAVQDWQGNKYIDFVPGLKLLLNADGKTYAKSKLFTFTVAGNKEGKTYLEQWEVTVTPDQVLPGPGPGPSPGPQPEPDSELYKTLQAQYLVSPSATALEALTKVYSEVKTDLDGGKFNNNKEVYDSLKTKTLARVTGIQPLRDAVSEQLAKVAPRASTLDKEPLSKLLGNIIACLEKLPR